MSAFNPDQFMDMVIEGSNDTKVVPIPVGEYMAYVESAKVRPWEAKDKSSSGLALDILWNIDDPQVKEFLGRDKVTCKQGVMLDVTEKGSLDMSKGKNVGIGRVREALGLNDPSAPFTFSMLVGRPARVSVTHRIDGEDIFPDIKRIAPL